MHDIIRIRDILGKIDFGPRNTRYIFREEPAGSNERPKNIVIRFPPAGPTKSSFRLLGQERNVRGRHAKKADGFANRLRLATTLQSAMLRQ